MNGQNINCRGIDYVDKCPANEVPKLSRDNKKAWFLIKKMLPGMFRGGGMDFSAVKLVMDLWHVSDGQQPVILDRCQALYDGLLNIKNEQKTQNRADS